MQALIKEMVSLNGSCDKSYFRSAYVWRFGRDLSQDSLEADIRNFNSTGNAPQYVCEYTCHIVGKCHA